MPTTNKMHWTYPAFRTKPYFNEIAAFFNEIDKSVFDLIVGAGGVFVNETTLLAAGGSSENFVHSCKDQFPSVTVAVLSDGLWVNGEGVVAITYVDANTVAAKNEGSEDIAPGGLRLIVLGSSQLRYGLTNVTNDAQLKRSAGDFASFTAKASPVAADLVLIEDSASGNAKKKATVGSLATVGPPGPPGISITWLGSLVTPPVSPDLNDAYYNTVDKISYIWDGDSWEILAKDGTGGTLPDGNENGDVLTWVDPSVGGSWEMVADTYTEIV